MKAVRYATGVLLAMITTAAVAQDSPLLGMWREPAGSILRIERCSTGLCLRLVSVSREAPVTTDVHNPDPALRNRALCNLQIGEGFYLDDSLHATGGRLYDPKSGKTYRGTMTVDGGELKLRGYIGSPIFGRTEVWQRAPESSAECTLYAR